jgi:hypothetical protein
LEVMITRITITLKVDEREALHVLAEREYRDLRTQAALIIRQELERRGLLPQEKAINSPSTSEPIAEPVHQPLPN